MGPISIERACEVLHDEYERAAQTAGPGGQRLLGHSIEPMPWAQVPESIKVARRQAMKGLFAFLHVESWVD